MDYEVLANDAPAVIGASGLEDVQQCIRYIVKTFFFSVPLDRGFANSGQFVDAPIPHAVARRMAELTEAIEKHEPRVRVTSINFLQGSASAAMDGRTFPLVRFRLREGVVV